MFFFNLTPSIVIVNIILNDTLKTNVHALICHYVIYMNINDPLQQHLC